MIEIPILPSIPARTEYQTSIQNPVNPRGNMSHPIPWLGQDKKDREESDTTWMVLSERKLWIRLLITQLLSVEIMAGHLYTEWR